MSIKQISITIVDEVRYDVEVDEGVDALDLVRAAHTILSALADGEAVGTRGKRQQEVIAAIVSALDKFCGCPADRPIPAERKAVQ